MEHYHGLDSAGREDVVVRRLFGYGDCPLTECIEALERENFSNPWTKAMLERALQEENKFFFGALQGDTLIGYIGGQLIVDEMEIFNVAVGSDHRGCHLGDRLVSALCTAAAEAGAERVLLEVRASNTPAIALYQKHGFAEVGRRKNYYEKPREDAVLMDLCL